LDDDWQVFVQATAQKVNKNIDSSEQIAVGGNYGVRAYPTGEASSDEGFVGTIEARRNLGSGWQAIGFYDYGFAHINKSPTDTNAYSLHGIGAGTAWSGNGALAKFQIAKPIGTNQGQQANGNDSDGLKPGVRAWASVQYRF